MRSGAPSPSRIAKIIAATLAVALLSACDEPAPPAAAIRPVRVATVEPLDVGQALSQTGEIQPRYETDLGFRIGRQILARPVDVESIIQRGDLLARLDDQRARSQLQSAQAGLAAVEAELTRAQAEEARQSVLLKDGFTTKQRYDTVVRDPQTAEAQRDSAKTKLTLGRENLGYLVADPAVKVVGRVRYTAPQAAPTTRTYAVRVSLPNAPPEMRLGATVTGRVELPAQNVVGPPGSSLFEKDRKPAVWVFDPGNGTV
jgi:multidrug efflux pump subunit AcrA (membrane-fusion protein)